MRTLATSDLSLRRLKFASGLAALAVLCASLFCYHLAQRDLWSSHEARAAQDAQTILSDGCWGLPRLFDRKEEMQKPPLYYWLVAGVSRLRGVPVDVWSVRLPAAVAALGCVLLLFAFGGTRGRSLAGMLSAVALATAMHYTWLARTGRIDMPLTLVVATALVCFFIAKERRQESNGRPSAGWLITAYLAVGIGILLKGPIGLALPLVVIALLALTEGRLRTTATDFGLWWGIPMALAVTGPWFVWANIHTHGQFFRTFFWYHNVERAFTDAVGHHAHAWWQYGPMLAVGMAPWSVLLVPAVWYLWWTGRLRSDAVARYGLVWLIAMIVLLSCARFKRADYLLPAYPGAALLLGCAGETWWQRTNARYWPAVLVTTCVLGCVGGWWYYIDRYLPRHEAEQEDRTFATFIRRLARPPSQVVIFFRTEEHALAFHVGRPLDTILEWENLDWWAGRPQITYVIMPPDIGCHWHEHLTKGRLEEVARNTDLAGRPRKRPLVLYRTRANPKPLVDRTSSPCPTQPSYLPLPVNPLAWCCWSATALHTCNRTSMVGAPSLMVAKQRMN